MLTDTQIECLARPLLRLYDVIEEFYKDPENMRRFREWHIERYGREPDDE